MTRGLYTAASGMVAGMQRQLQLASTIANVNTPGYKADRFTTKSFPGVLLNAQQSAAFGGRSVRLGTGAVLTRLGVDLSPGTLSRTGGTLDTALDGEGFFVVRDEAENLRLTRDGHFIADGDGFLVTTDGFQLLSQTNQPIRVTGGQIEIQSGGQVLVNGEQIAVIRLAAAPGELLLRAGGSTFVVENEADLEAAQARVVQGSLEGSNVNTTQALTEMMSIARSYESTQRIFAMQSQILGQTVRDIGRV